MAIIVCCDFSIKNSPNHEKFLYSIQKHEGCCQIAASSWVIVTPDTPKQVRDTLSQYLQPEDRLFVANLEKGSGSWEHVLESSVILQNLIKK